MLQFPQMSSASENTVRTAAVIDTTNLSGKTVMSHIKVYCMLLDFYLSLLLLVCIHHFIP